MASRKTIDGGYYEDLAASWLQQQGLVLLARNYRARCGEIDLVMRHGEYIVFVEVKYRRRSDYGGPLEQLRARQRARIIRTAGHYLQSRRSSAPCRFDMVAISGTNPWHYEWIEHAFDAF